MKNVEFVSIDFQLDIDLISLFILENDIPLSKIQFEYLRVVFKKLLDKVNLFVYKESHRADRPTAGRHAFCNSGGKALRKFIDWKFERKLGVLT